MPATTNATTDQPTAPGQAPERVEPAAIPDHPGVHRHDLDQDDAQDRLRADDDGAVDKPFPAPGPVSAAVLWLIRGYQRLLSPALPPACRFVPSCSQYGYEAIAKYGIIRGGRLAVWRVLRCNPFGGKGYDPVP